MRINSIGYNVGFGKIKRESARVLLNSAKNNPEEYKAAKALIVKASSNNYYDVRLDNKAWVVEKSEDAPVNVNEASKDDKFDTAEEAVRVADLFYNGELSYFYEYAQNIPENEIISQFTDEYPD